LSFFREYQSVLFKILVSASLIGFLFFFAQPAQIIESIRNVDFSTYVLGIFIYLAAQVVYAGKWHLLLPEVEFFVLLKFTFIGAFYSLVLPGQISGEIAKTWRLGKGTRIAELVAASVFIDRITGIIALLLLALIGASFSTSEAAAVIVFPCAVLVIILFLSLFLMRIPAIELFSKTVARWMMHPFPFLQNQLPKVLRLLEHLAYYSNAHQKLLVSICIGFIFQSAVVAIAFLFARALGISIGLLDLSWIMGVISLLVFLPISISGMGVRELGFVGILHLFEVDISTALTLSLLLFSMQIVGAAIGAVFELSVKGKI
jgi:uncharacterized protein (TIRG00374 family)